MSDIAISVDGLGKRYRIGHQRDPYGRLTESLAAAVRAPWDRLRGRSRTTTEWFWALRDVSFEVKSGEVVGVIGRNGAGKTTLLKILSRITEPTTGVARLRGRVGSLLEVGTGFHPELTGRENVFMSGAVLGMRRAEIIRKFDEIVDFAGVEQFLDTPVKRYSSGMQVRLGFAVAAHLEPEILVVDEVLAVGDAEFQRKSVGKLESVAQSGRTVLFVSHNLAAVEVLCSSGILLDKGQVVTSGPVAGVVESYLSRSRGLDAAFLINPANRRGSGELRITSIHASIRTGAPSELRLQYQAQIPVRRVSISVGFFTVRGEGALYLSNDLTGDSLEDLPPAGELVCRLQDGALIPGRYSLNVYCTVNGFVADWVIDAAVIDVLEGDYYGTGKLPPPGYGSVPVRHDWSAKA
jgi:lipopolysaccharide transport system ATP-binding protein